MLRHETSDLKKQIESSEYEKEKIVEEKEHKFNLLNASYIDKIRKLDVNIDGLENALRQMKGTYYTNIFQKLLTRKTKNAITTLSTDSNWKGI